MVASPTTKPTPRWSRAARAEDVAGDGPHAVSVDGVDLVAVRAGGALRVFEGRCPHQGALLGEGELDGGHLVCRNHRWRFDATTGKRAGGAHCLRACPSEVRDGALWVDVTALADDGAGRAARRTFDDLPGPRAWPLLGNAPQIDLARFHLQLEAWARQYGPVYRLNLGGRRFVAISDPDLIEQVARDRPDGFRRSSRVEPVFDELRVAGVFAAEGAAWRSQRRLAMEALAHKNLRGFYATLADLAARLRRRWQRAADAGAVVDIQDDLMRFTVDVTTALAFGHDLHTLDGDEDVIQQHLSLIFPAFARRLNAVIPYWRVLRLPRDRAVDRAVAAVHAWIAELIAAARARLAAEPARAPANFLESMVAARDADGRPFDDATIAGNAMTMLLAGEDTTANTLAFAVHLLCDHPAEVDALRAELAAVVGDAPVPPDLERAGRLDHAAAIANETMRLHPVAPLNFFEALRDTVVGDVAVPTGTGVVALTRVAAVDDRHFGDAAAFRPARWRDDRGGAGAHDPAAFTPFGTGPRICPGRSLALLEMRVVLATLYQGFEVERVGARDDVREHYAFTVFPEHLRVRLRARRPA